MKKAISLIIALALCMAFAACGTTKPATTNAPVVTTEAAIETTEAVVETTEAVVETTEAPVATTEGDAVLEALSIWVEANKESLLASMEESFATSSGMTCTSDIEIVGTGIVMTININELENVPQETKDQLQATYDSMADSFTALLDQMQSQIPQLTYFTIVVGDKNGDALATITAGEQ